MMHQFEVKKIKFFLYFLNLACFLFYKVCTLIAHIMKSAVEKFGCKAYHNGQLNACKCPVSKHY